ncbi:hypothetical protein Chor_005334 [Crotalus horridus]
MELSYGKLSTEISFLSLQGTAQMQMNRPQWPLPVSSKQLLQTIIFSISFEQRTMVDRSVLRDDDPPRRVADGNATYYSSPHPPLFPVRIALDARLKKMDGTRTPRDERRRAQHNEVERRRRDKINNWIVQLSKIIPDCNTDNSKTGAIEQLKNENALLRAQLQQHGIEMVGDAPGQ